MRIWLLIFSCFLIACSESFMPASAVSEFRVVAARVDLPAEPGRANPSPGDLVEVSLLPIDRGAPEPENPNDIVLTPAPLQWALVPCVPLPVTIGTPLCGPVIAPCEGCLATPPADPLAYPVVRFEMPSSEELEQAGSTSALVQGIVCSNGVPSADAIQRFIEGESDELVFCEGEPVTPDRPIEGRVVAVTIPVEEDPADPNLHPELLSLVLDGRQWPPPYDQGVPRDAPLTGCAADIEGLTEEERMAHPRAGEEASSINLAVTQDSLQTYAVGNQEMTEEIQVSWLADGGGFESTFSFIIDPARSILTQWKPFESVPEDGVLVRFNFVIRDGRSGTDWVERGLCILPP